MLAILSLQQEVSELEGITLVQGPLPYEIAINGQAIPVNAVFIETNYQQLADFIEQDYFMTDQFLSGNRIAGILMVTLSPDASGEAVIDSLHYTTEKYDQFETSIAGNEVIKKTLSDYLLRIILILLPMVIILIITVFSLMLRNFRLAVFSMIPAALGALWTFGTIFWTGEGLSVVTIITPLFIVIIGSAYGLHYTSHLLDNLDQYKDDKHKLTVETIKRVGTPIFLATITTMAGFASLTWTDVVPMRLMGIYVTLGIGYAGFLAIFFFPAVLSRIKLPQKPSISSENRLTRYVLAASKQRVIIVIAFVTMSAVAVAYIPGLGVSSNQLMFFKENSDIRQTFNKVEEHFGGAMPLTGEIGASDPTAALFDIQYAEKILATERELEDIHGIASVFSVFDLMKGINKMSTGQDLYPQSPGLIQGIIAQLGENKARWMADDGFRILIKTQDITNDDTDSIESFVQDNDDIRVITGLPVLFNEMNSLIVRSQIQSLGLALIVVFLMLWITLRRLSAAFIGLVPIAISVACILGMLSITGYNLNIMTATLSAIAVGVGIDYSVHILSSIYYYHDRGAGRMESVTHALSTTSRPIMANALGLIAGYSVFFFSPLQIHVHIAAVMWVAMFISSAAALLLVPIFYSGKAPIPKAKTR